jgi:hypothetical protein
MGWAVMPTVHAATAVLDRDEDVKGGAGRPCPRERSRLQGIVGLMRDQTVPSR